MNILWQIVAWIMSLLVPASDIESARCAACVTVAYAVQARGLPPNPGPEPEPEPSPEGCVSGCSCEGTGWVKTPEGFRIPCPCPPECQCKKAEKRGEK